MAKFSNKGSEGFQETENKKSEEPFAGNFKNKKESPKEYTVGGLKRETGLRAAEIISQLRNIFKLEVSNVRDAVPDEIYSKFLEAAQVGFDIYKFSPSEKEDVVNRRRSLAFFKKSSCLFPETQCDARCDPENQICKGQRV